MNQAVSINRKRAMPGHLIFSIKPINQLIELYVSVPDGGAHNDTIVTVERKR